MSGERLQFVSLDMSDIEHRQVIDSLGKSSSYLGNLKEYQFHSNPEQITGNDYLVKDGENYIGYLGLSDTVSTAFGRTVSIYYSVLENFYGHRYGKRILEDTISYLKENTDVDILIANVDNTNVHGLRTIELANFCKVLEDDEETQYHRHL